MQGPSRLPQTLPLLPLKDIVFFPEMLIPVFVGEDLCIDAVKASLKSDRLLFLSAFSCTNIAVDAASPEFSSTLPPPFDVYDMGVIAKVLRYRQLPEGRAKVVVQGRCRARIVGLQGDQPYPMVNVMELPDLKAGGLGKGEKVRLIGEMKTCLERLSGRGRGLPPDVLMMLEDVNDLGKLADLVSSQLMLPMADAQFLLGSTDPVARVHRLLAYLGQMVEDAEEPVCAFRPEPKRPVPSEETPDPEVDDDIEDLRARATRIGMPDQALHETLRQIRRLERMAPESSEAALTRTYVEWMLDLPWMLSSETTCDLKTCANMLDDDHYGLEKVKDRILEFIAVRRLNAEHKGAILCFVGPPGVGKTSLGRSIARVLGRPFARISLGGVKDEAEIRGHRRTYVGAQPGRIIQAIRNAKSRSPVLMLDEIDKLGSDYKGDPASALLEILDPEQNRNFSDHYISVPYDLSEVVFIANANRLDTIPPALRDRLEIIEVDGYSEEEKLQIAERYIIPKTVQQNGLSDDLISFERDALSVVIQSYTRESGLRNLERQLARISRKVARSIAETDEEGGVRRRQVVTSAHAIQLLGAEKFLPPEHNPDAVRVGVAVGLAYTSCGGEILEIEVNLVPGTGKLILTGHLGDVMKESAQTALSWLHCHAELFRLDGSLFRERDIHLHVPAGAVPKDGPSAGISIAMALVSAVCRLPMRQDVAMTGELTLHGRVLPVGGLREKILAALRMGVRRVLVPAQNRGAISEIPESIRKAIAIEYVSDAFAVIERCFPGFQIDHVRTAPLPACVGAEAGVCP